MTANATIPVGNSMTVPDGYTFVIPDGITLTVNGTLVANGTLTVNGTLINNGNNTVFIISNYELMLINHTIIIMFRYGIVHCNKMR
jgi:hypothetical protein